VVATADFGCNSELGDRPSPDGCSTNVDDRALTITGTFDGALVLDTHEYSEWGHQAWFLALPGTAPFAGPGGSVTAVLTPGPQRQFRVMDVACVGVDASSTDEVAIPAIVDGNTASIPFDVAPEQDGETVDCIFRFDPAALPRLRLSPTDASVPPTDTRSSIPVPRRDVRPLDLVSVVLAIVVACAVLTVGPLRRVGS
jgi:hypothetical protein